jgi:tetratricopeptide (TPR) repeat protein
MNQFVESRPNSSLNSLRNALEKAERSAVHLDASNIEATLMLLDQIEQMFAEFGQDKSTLRSEEGRWQGLCNRISAKPELVTAAAAHAGGLAKLRAQNPPAAGFWWHLDAQLAQRRAQTLKRTAITVGAVVAVVALVLWGINYFASPNSKAGSLANTTSQVEKLVQEQKWQEALAVVKKARQTLPDEPALLVWEGVLTEQLGDSTGAATNLEQARQKLADQPVVYWMLVGNARLQVGNLDGAEQAAQQALVLAPQDAQVTFLLGSVAEARGNTIQAADFFSKTVALAGDANPQLGVIAKVRMGNLLQRAEPLPQAAPSPIVTQTLTPQSQ